MIATLPMYLWPANRAAHDRLWGLIRDGLRARAIPAPAALDNETDHMTGWARPDLVLSQICNLPYRALFRGKVTLIGAADHALPDTAPGYYHSVFVVRADDPAQTLADTAGYPMAYNEPLSNSGWGVPQQFAAAQGLTLTPALHTGAHRASLAAVAQGRADLAALDAQTWVCMQRWDPLAAQVRVIGRTHATPGMTFITAAGQDPAPYFAAISAAIAALPATDRDMLNLRGIVALPDAAYDIPLPPFPAVPPN
jgi:ABC-type phosphate/phosphonate transport system substrate-binding protein